MHWSESQKGLVEYYDVTQNFQFDVERYDELVAPFMALWQQCHDIAANPPPPTPDELAAQRRAAILARLAAIDAASVRPLRAINAGQGTDFDTQKLAALNAEAAQLRAELAALG